MREESRIAKLIEAIAKPINWAEMELWVEIGDVASATIIVAMEDFEQN